MHLNIFLLFSFVAACNAASLYPNNRLNLPCGYCMCCGPMTAVQSPCCQMGCVHKCDTVFLPAPVPTIAPSSPSTLVSTELTTTLAPTTVLPLIELPSPVPCTIETCPPSPLVDPINLPPQSENFENLPQGPPATSPYPMVQIPPVRLPSGEEGRQPIPCGNPVPSCGSPCAAPSTAVVPSAPCTNQPCQAPCSVLPPLEAQPCCFITFSDGNANVFCGCEGNGTCISNAQQAVSTCKSQTVLSVNVKGTFLVPCHQAAQYGIDLSKIDGCPADGLTGSASGLTIFMSIALATLTIFVSDF